MCNRARAMQIYEMHRVHRLSFSCFAGLVGVQKVYISNGKDAFPEFKDLKRTYDTVD